MNAHSTISYPGLIGRFKGIFFRPSEDRSHADRATSSLIRAKVRSLDAEAVEKLCGRALGSRLKASLATVKVDPARGPYLLERDPEGRHSFSTAANVFVYAKADDPFYVGNFRIRLRGSLGEGGDIAWRGAEILN